MKIFLSYQDQFGKWRQYQTKQNELDAYRVAKLKAKQMNKRFRLTDGNGRVLDLFSLKYSNQIFLYKTDITY